MKTAFTKNAVKCALALTWVVGLVSLFQACQQDDVAPAPTITRVRTVSRDSVFVATVQTTLTTSYTAIRTIPVAFDSTTTLGLPGRTYAIIGNNLLTTTAVYFNEFKVEFNPAYLTNTSIIVNIPGTTPFAGNNKLRVVTTGGTAEFDFRIKQPFAGITAVDQLAGNAGDIITITGTTFDGVSSVKFGAITAEITSMSATELKVKVPAGVKADTISVTTPGGTTKYGIPFGFNYLIFDDALATGWVSQGFNGTPTVPSKGVIKRGTASMQYDYTGGFGGWQNFSGGDPIDLTKYKLLKFSLYGGSGTEGKVVKVLLNGNYNGGMQLVLKAGVWQTFAIPLTALGVTTGNLTEVTFQEFSGNVPETIYIDDMGLY